jgi:hypothetical protein
MPRSTVRKFLLILGAVTCAMSVSSFFWSDVDGYDSGGSVLALMLMLILGASVLVEYLLDKPLRFGFIEIPVGATGFRELLVCAAFAFMALPFLIAFGVYD